MAIIVPENYSVPLHLFHQGENSHAYEFFGSHRDVQDGKPGASASSGISTTGTEAATP